MGSWRRMGAFLGLVAEEDARRGDYEYAGDDYSDDDYPGPEYLGGGDAPYDPGFPRDSGRNPARGGRTRPADGAGGEPMVHGALAVQMLPETRRGGESATSLRPLTVKLTGFGEARIIGERYRDGASVILDMTDLTDAEARRVVDFAAGLAFALRGSIDKITARVFMLLPPDADLSAEDRRAFAGSFTHR